MVFPFVCFVLFGFVSGLPYPRQIPGRLPARSEVSILLSFLETCYSPKLCSSTSDASKLSPGCGTTNITFIIIRSCYLSFCLSFSPKCTVEFSRICLACDITADWVHRQIENPDVFQKVRHQRHLQQCKTMPLIFSFC